MKKQYKINKEWLDLLIEHKNNENVTFNLSDNDIRILLTYIEVLQQGNARLKDKFEKAIEHIKELDDNTDDTTCYDIDKYVKEDLLNILKEN